jgi:hypothetical protein
MATANTVSGAEGKMLTNNSNTELLITEWELEENPTLGIRTNSTTGGNASRGLVSKDSKFNVSFLYDTALTPTAAAIRQGDTGVMKCRIGNSSLGYMSVSYITGTTSTRNDVGSLVAGRAELFVQGALPDPSTYS